MADPLETTAIPFNRAKTLLLPHGALNSLGNPSYNQKKGFKNQLYRVFRTRSFRNAKKVSTNNSYSNRQRNAKRHAEELPRIIREAKERFDKRDKEIYDNFCNKIDELSHLTQEQKDSLKSIVNPFPPHRSPNADFLIDKDVLTNLKSHLTSSENSNSKRKEINELFSNIMLYDYERCISILFASMTEYQTIIYKYRLKSVSENNTGDISDEFRAYIIYIRDNKNELDNILSDNFDTLIKNNGDEYTILRKRIYSEMDKKHDEMNNILRAVERDIEPNNKSGTRDNRERNRGGRRTKRNKRSARRKTR
jgi:hypothetical protein